jgi:enamine deaminase RidA (YjgF/YER057c/UK114 family)
MYLTGVGSKPSNRLRPARKTPPESSVIGACKTASFQTGVSMSIENRLTELGIVLPALGPTIGTFVHPKQFGQLLFMSGKGPLYPDGFRAKGKLGADMNTDEGYKHARHVGILLIAAMKEMLDGDLDRVDGVLKVFGLVNATADYGDHFKVVNGCSDLFVSVFGEKGAHARTAAGANSLPNGIPVEIEAIIALRS